MDLYPEGTWHGSVWDLYRTYSGYETVEKHERCYTLAEILPEIISRDLGLEKGYLKKAVANKSGF